MKAIVIVLLVCLTALFINHEQCELKLFELQLQMEIAKALGRATKPSLELRPDDSGDRKPERNRL